MIRRLRPRGDDGFTLTEVMVGSAVMATVMAVATGGFLAMYRTTDRTEAAAMTQTALMTSFAKLDREVRYAYRVNPPYVIGGDRAYAVDYVVPDADNARYCVQLSLPVAGGTLTRTTWPQSSTMTAGTTVSAVATDLITSTAGVSPFVLKASGSDGANFDRLVMSVTSTVGSGGNGTSRGYALQFTALNTVTDAITCRK